MLETLPHNIVFTTDGAFPLSTDTVQLSKFVRLSAKSRVFDLGCGSGALSFLLASRYPTAMFSGVELDPGSFQCAQENRARNPHIHFDSTMGNLVDYRQFPANSFTHVVSNPPYFEPNRGYAHQSHQTARAQVDCTLESICQAASWLLQYGGTFSLVYRPEALCDLLCTLRANKLEPKRIQFVQHTTNAPISLVLLEAKLGGNPGLHYLPNLLLCTP